MHIYKFSNLPLLSWIFSSLPVNKQMLALSATYPESLAQHLTLYMREPTFVRLNPSDMGLKGEILCSTAVQEAQGKCNFILGKSALPHLYIYKDLYLPAVNFQLSNRSRQL